ncbi:MAG TPA: DUF2231 domain-containing protein [Actinomycetota bacterium]|nr:DUF2231 domain-containing protein [Actinomycetota bacterium]
MDWVFGDLPLHPLVVHLTVVLIPIAALTLVLAAVWPAARRRLGLLPPILALIALVLVPITTAAGTWLADRVGRTPLVDRHEDLGNSMLPWVIAMFVAAVAVWAWHKFFTKATGRVRLVGSVVLAVAAIAIAAGSVVTIVQIGESGATAVWTGNFSEDPVPAP